MATIETKAVWEFNERPTKDGEYVCMLGWNKGQLRVSTLGFTTTYGWNTHMPEPDEDEPVGWPDDGYLHCWLCPETFPTWEEIRQIEEASECSSTQ